MTARLVQIVRIPVLVALFAAVGPPYVAYMDAMRRIDAEAQWVPWAQMAILGGLFIAVALFGRQRRHSLAVLVAEAVVAAALVLPATAWFQLLGQPSLSDFIEWSTFNLFSRALAIAWLVIAIATVVRQVRGQSAPRVGAGNGATSES